MGSGSFCEWRDSEESERLEKIESVSGLSSSLASTNFSSVALFRSRIFGGGGGGGEGSCRLLMRRAIRKMSGGISSKALGLAKWETSLDPTKSNT